MPEYTPLGIEKIMKQAQHSLELIRCPRDSVVMRILGGRAARRDGSGCIEEFLQRLPTTRYWTVREVDLECPACRRRAPAIRVGDPTSSSAAVRHRSASSAAQHV